MKNAATLFGGTAAGVLSSHAAVAQSGAAPDAKTEVGQGPIIVASAANNIVETAAGKVCGSMRKGDPNHPGLSHWSKFNAADCPTMIFDNQCVV